MKNDERQQMHKHMASRWAYFGTILVLVAGVVEQGFGGKIDPWLVIAICMGLLIKIAGLIYAMYKK